MRAILDDVCLCVWAFVHFSNGLSSLGELAIERLRPWHVILAHPFTKDPPHRTSGSPPFEVRCTRRCYRPTMVPPFVVWCRRLLLFAGIIPNKKYSTSTPLVADARLLLFSRCSYYYSVPFRLDTTLCSWRWMMMLAAPAVAAGSCADSLRLLRLMLLCRLSSEIPVWYPRSVKYI